ncbi:MAG: hypothetical protein ABR599_04785 [Gemmatimonadota bacterium]
MDEIPARRMRGAPAPDWKPIRHHLGILGFGVNAYVARSAGDALVPEHDEVPAEGPGLEGHEELYFVSRGRARFRVDGEDVDAPAGTLVFVRDPTVVRSAVAAEDGTTVLVAGAQPGIAFSVSPWETSYLGS